MSEKGTNITTIRKRESRARHTELHQRATFITEYIRVKYEHAYEEADSFYRKLAEQCPLKRKLTTAPEFQVWKSKIIKSNAAITDMAPISSSTTTTELCDATPADVSSTTTTELYNAIPVDVSLNIPLMNPVDVQETRDMVMFQDIYPSITEEINPKIINQVIREIEETAPDFFDEYDQEMNSIIQDEINASLSMADPLEQELLYY